MLGGDDRTVFGFDPERKVALAIAPAGKLPARRRDRTIDGGTAALDHFLGNPFALPYLLRRASRQRHRLPLPARVFRIDSYKQPCEPARLPGIHEYASAGPHEIGRSLV